MKKYDHDGKLGKMPEKLENTDLEFPYKPDESQLGYNDRDPLELPYKVRKNYESNSFIKRYRKELSKQKS